MSIPAVQYTYPQKGAVQKSGYYLDWVPWNDGDNDLQNLNSQQNQHTPMHPSHEYTCSNARTSGLIL